MSSPPPEDPEAEEATEDVTPAEVAHARRLAEAIRAGRHAEPIDPTELRLLADRAVGRLVARADRSDEATESEDER